MLFLNFFTDNEDYLTDFGGKALKKFIKNVPVGSFNETNFPEGVFLYNHEEKIPTKRQSPKTARLLESEEQGNELSPKKKKVDKPEEEVTKTNNKQEEVTKTNNKLEEVTKTNNKPEEKTKTKQNRKKPGDITKKTATEKTSLSISNEMLETELGSQFDDDEEPEQNQECGVS